MSLACASSSSPLFEDELGYSYFYFYRRVMSAVDTMQVDVQPRSPCVDQKIWPGFALLCQLLLESIYDVFNPDTAYLSPHAVTWAFRFWLQSFLLPISTRGAPKVIVDTNQKKSFLWDHNLSSKSSLGV